MEEEQSGEPGRTVAKGTKAKGNGFSGPPPRARFTPGASLWSHGGGSGDSKNPIRKVLHKIIVIVIKIHLVLPAFFYELIRHI